MGKGKFRKRTETVSFPGPALRMIRGAPKEKDRHETVTVHGLPEHEQLTQQ